MFSKFFKRSSFIDIIISLIFVLFGVLLVSKPEATVGAISIILGILFMSMGVLKLVEYYTSETKDDYLLTVAVILVIVGVIIFFASDSILSIFRFILGLWIIATGVMDLQTILVWKEVKSPYWTTSLIMTLLMIIAGIVVISTPTIVTTALGIIIVIYAIFDIVDRIIFMKKINDFEKNIKND